MMAYSRQRVKRQRWSSVRADREFIRASRNIVLVTGRLCRGVWEKWGGKLLLRGEGTFHLGRVVPVGDSHIGATFKTQRL